MELFNPKQDGKPEHYACYDCTVQHENNRALVEGALTAAAVFSILALVVVLGSNLWKVFL
jgi:hypothetical protein